jgi:hypothetical protein
VTRPKVEEESYRREPKIVCGHVHLHRSVIIEPGEDFSVFYPACEFFDALSVSVSFKTFRAVPLNMASLMAFL